MWSPETGLSGTENKFIKGFYRAISKKAISEVLGKVTREMCPDAFPVADLFDYVTEFVFGKE